MIINIGENIISEPYMVVSLSSSLFTGIAFMMLILGGFFYLLNGLKRDNNEEKFIMIGFAISFIVTGITVILIFYLYFQINLIYVNGVFYGTYKDSKHFYDTLLRIIIIFQICAQLPIILSFERIIKRTKYLFSIIIMILIVVLIPLPYDLFVISYSIIWTINQLILFLILIFLAKWSPMEFKAISVTLLFGITMIAFYAILENQDIKSLNVFPLELGPLLIIIGVIVCLSPAIINPKSFSHPLTYWYTFGFFEIIIFLAFTILILSSPIPFYILALLLISDVIIFYFIFDAIKHVKYVMSEVSTRNLFVERDQRKDLLSMFSRPQKLTEEEVSVSKEKKICLVCKGSVIGFNSFICKCDTLYCENCARTMSNLENSCWVCNEPFDESKPVKLPKLGEANVVVENEIHKGKKT